VECTLNSFRLHSQLMFKPDQFGRLKTVLESLELMAKFILSMTQLSTTMIKLVKCLSVMMQILRAFTRLVDHTCLDSHSEHDLNLINLKSL
jgi:hypothetical protein